jgi:uncharacterized membrane protein YgdD (TMEM256/DUF423 family)
MPVKPTDSAATPCREAGGDDCSFPSPETAARVAALTGLLAVVLGAFGAHGLRDLLARNATATIWEKAVFYHFIHAVMLYVLAGRRPFPALAWWAFLAGVVVFSGSLYLLAVTGERWLGAITPVGGVGFIIGWTVLAGQTVRKPG